MASPPGGGKSSGFAPESRAVRRLRCPAGGNPRASLNFCFNGSSSSSSSSTRSRSIFRFLLIVPERLWGNEFAKIILNGSPQGRFEHSRMLPGAKLHADHDGNSEIIS